MDWLAFYQPATFGDDHQWCIEVVTPVRGHELATRGELFKDQLDPEILALFGLINGGSEIEE